MTGICRGILLLVSGFFLAGARAASSPEDAALAEHGAVLRQDIRRTCISLCEAWAAAVAAHPAANQPSWRAAAEQLQLLRTATAKSLEGARLVYVDKARLSGSGDVDGPDYRYRQASDRVEFNFPFADGNCDTIVVVWDRRAVDRPGLENDLRIDYLMRTTDLFVTLAVRQVHERLMRAPREDTQVIENHIFGEWYVARALGTERSELGP